MLATCLFVMGTTHVMASSDDDEKISIPIGTGKPVHGDDARDMTIVPFAAYYQGGTIYISTSAEFAVISINVENKSQTWSSASDISDGMGEISIVNGGAGNYTVEIVTEFGECFVGSFTL